LLGHDEEERVEQQLERRKLRRLVIDFPVTFRFHGTPPEQEQIGELVNLTLQGGAVEGDTLATVGDVVALQFPLQSGVSCEVEHAKVIHARPLEGGRYLMGLHFMHFRPGDAEKLDAYLKLLKMLQGTALFKKLTLTEVKRILSIAREERYSEGQGIFSEGVKALALYIVISGAVKITKRNSRGLEEPLAIIREGEVFGEMALLDEYPRAATASAHRHSVLLRIASEDFKALMEEQGELANKLLWSFVQVLCRRLREADKQIVETFSSTTSLAGHPPLW